MKHNSVRIKFVITSIFFFSFCSSSVGQKLANTDIESASSYTNFPALIQHIEKPTTMTAKFPTSLRYSSGNELGVNANIPGNWGLGGKWLTSEGEYQLIFVCNGAAEIKEGKGRIVKANPNNAYDQTTCYVKDYEIFMPSYLYVLHKNDTLKVIELTSRTKAFNIVFHKGLVDDAARASGINGFAGFTNDIEAERYLPKAFKVVELEVYKKILYILFNAERHLLKNFLTNGETTTVGYVKKKKRDYNYDDFDSTIEKYKAVLKLSKVPSAENDKIFNECIQQFEKMLNSNEARIDANVKELIYYNLGHCCARVGETAKARNYANLSAKTLESYQPNMFIFLRNYILEIEIRQELQKSKYVSLANLGAFSNF